MKYFVLLFLLSFLTYVWADKISCRVVGSEVTIISSNKYKPQLHVDLFFSDNSVSTYTNNHNLAQKSISESDSTYSSLTYADNWRNSYDLNSNYSCWTSGSTVVMTDPDMTASSNLSGFIVALIICCTLICLPCICAFFLVLLILLSFGIITALIILVCVVVVVICIVAVAIFVITFPVWGLLLVCLILAVIAISAIVLVFGGIGFGIYWLYKRRSKSYKEMNENAVDERDLTNVPIPELQIQQS
jgi:hypothetical protein